MSYVPLGLYRHFKGDLYVVFGHGRHSETQEEMVAYRSATDPSSVWFRPASMWFEKVTDSEGRKVPRFRGVTGQSLIEDECQRQYSEEKWSSQQDDTYLDDELTIAAMLYAEVALQKQVRVDRVVDLAWPFSPEFDKRSKHGPLRCLVIAGALLAQEINRRLRKGETP